MADEKKKGPGRPTKFNETLTQKILDYAEQGLTDEQIAETLGINPCSIYLWKNKHPEFSKALKDAKDAADGLVETSLFQNAMAGNVTAQIFWLKNRRPTEWRDKQEISHTDPDGNPLPQPQIIITMPSNGREKK